MISQRFKINGLQNIDVYSGRRKSNHAERLVKGFDT